ncbi:tetratricopeptide (TPR) repeat protein [Dyadobacter sp. BE34]|uniref:Tetratricopeptide (TPR) repeat protein n=1 Tax=Dyadobacter fermentans TaxID=94254 RepID=A0ABU1R8D8_9BACT|nr:MULTISPECIES: RagB/SusD family nutrient uptake outer membrane protein [Dyadobacter]MDR6809669.1 tetratricopeptide (TPR) repeat protein [Dyadobacter fermentans]MDR7047347.1 tetratricopeptide (TPR) repeat protein [Dyadobacter sp. BE242]MDR7201582.1 tetratricopeptide (TPR) repeat protein [Dyadobacter sp. BE34]MDR7219452.1 tetratricopeptide (TPR) repeat protein [Dyadobacter sp. BE31]MDR7267153.1 tetratricopeptide (TPR) repeat protein [Dyadobacter sp. BE32]
MKNLKSLFLATTLAIFSTCCQKQNEWLDVKRSLSDVAPSTLADMQAILDNSNFFNASYSMLALLGTDNLYLSDKNLSAISQIERNVYLWAKDLFQTAPSTDFSSGYVKISAINIVLEGLDKMKLSGAEQSMASQIEGQARFQRAFAYYSLAQLFCKPFHAQTASTDLGLQLRTSSDPNIVVKRSTVAQTYDFILSDLNRALEILPESPTHLTRPGKRACRGLMAKVYLAMGDYENAKRFADQALGSKFDLLDFNSEIIKKDDPFLFPAYSNPHQNPELVFYAASQSWASMWPVYGVANVDSTLYDSYSAGDLRKTMFFRQDSEGRPIFTGSYTGTYYNFGGIAINEILLILAESLARTGDADGGLALVNKLLFSRFKTGAFKPYIHHGEQSSLRIIVDERRKELAFTAQLRWEDLRRLPPQKPLTRLYQGVRYELGAGDPRWVFPFPDQEVNLSSIEQNIR